jgi:transcriptional regulator with XRE-family HTH domain
VAGKVPKELNRNYRTPSEALGAVITGLRLEKGWSDHKVSSDVDCDPAYMNAIEHGTRNPTFGLLQAIADVHKVKLSQLIAHAERRHQNCRKKKA